MPLSALVSAVLPSACAACGLPGPMVCGRCHAGLAPLPQPRCRRCDHPSPVPLERCARCPAWLAASRQAVGYEGPAPALVRALKRGRPALAAPLGDLLAAGVPRPPAGAVLVPVPLGPRRLAARGYNQSALLARRLASRWELPVHEALDRVHEEAQGQRGAGAVERARRTRSAFRARAGTPPRHAVLVDDVLTSGATLAACARALRAAGAGRVDAVALARAVARGIAAASGSPGGG